MIINIMQKMNYHKIGLFFILIATFASIIILPRLDEKIISLESEITDFKAQVTDNIIAYLQYGSLENRIEIYCLRSDVIAEHMKETMFQKIFSQSESLAKAYSVLGSFGEEQKKSMKNVEEKIKEIKSSSNVYAVRIPKIMSLFVAERSKALIRMDDFQDKINKSQNKLKNNQQTRSIVYLYFAVFQIFGLILISLKQIIKE